MQAQGSHQGGRVGKRRQPSVVGGCAADGIAFARLKVEASCHCRCVEADIHLSPARQGSTPCLIADGHEPEHLRPTDACQVSTVQPYVLVKLRFPS
jgi:hypothetical protein